MKTMITKISLIFMLAMMLCAAAVPVMAADTQTETETEAVEDDADNTTNAKAYAAAIAVGLAAGAGAIGMAIAIAKSVEGVSRQPEASGKIQTMLMLGLVFVETAIIYALIVAILIIFVL